MSDGFRSSNQPEHLRAIELTFVESAPARREDPTTARLAALEARIEQIEKTSQQRPDTTGPDLSAIVPLLTRIADAIAPEPEAIVDSRYVANKLGCTTTWVSEMVRKGDIPRSCVVVGTGNGKVWKFYREKIEAWIASR
jgi:predicted DNA-binding transcriptional regulator AlpA